MLNRSLHRSVVRPLQRPLKANYSTKTPLSVAFKTNDDDEEDVRYRAQKNPVVPSVVNLELRWAKMDAGQQDDVIAYLEKKMRSSWHDLTPDEKRATYYIWYGNWGPRDPHQRDMANLYIYFGGTISLTAAGLALYKYATYDETKAVPGINYS